MKAEEYLFTWLDKKYGGSKELGEWTPKDVIEFADDFAKQEAIEFYMYDTGHSLGHAKQKLLEFKQDE